jgi:hypothetical protein
MLGARLVLLELELLALELELLVLPTILAVAGTADSLLPPQAPREKPSASTRKAERILF